MWQGIVSLLTPNLSANCSHKLNSGQGDYLGVEFDGVRNTPEHWDEEITAMVKRKEMKEAEQAAKKQKAA